MAVEETRGSFLALSLQHFEAAIDAPEHDRKRYSARLPGFDQ